MKSDFKYWIIADTHFGHNRMIELCHRPTNYEQLLIDNLKANVKENDILIHLGDVCFYRYEEWHEQLRSINCFKKWLCIGNHDSKSNIWYLRHGWDFVSYTIKLNLFGCGILFSHKPLKDDGYEINIHGHLHNIESHRLSDPEVVENRNDKQYLISVENTNYMPVNLQTILSKIYK